MSKRESLTRGSVLFGAKSLIIVFVGYALNLFLARQLGAADFGLLAVILSLIVWMEQVMQGGVPSWVTRVVARTDGSIKLPAGYVFIHLGIAVLMFVALVLLSPAIAEVFNEPDAAGLFALAAIDIPLIAVYGLLTAVITGRQLYSLSLKVQVFYSLSKLALSIALVLAGLAVTGAVLGSVLATVLGAIFAWFLLTREVGSSQLVVTDPIPDRVAAAKGSVVPAIVKISRDLMIVFDLWLTKAVLTAAATGIYRAAMLIGMIPLMIGGAVGTAFYSAYERAYTSGDTEKANHYLVQSTRLAMFLGGLWIAVVVPTGPALLETLFTSEYSDGGILVMIAAGAFGVAAISQVASSALLVQNRYKLLIGAVLSLALLELILLLVLIGPLGITGVALAVSSVFLIAGILSYVFMSRFAEGSFGRMLIGNVAPIVGVAALAWFISPPPGILLILSYLGFVLVYLLLQHVMGGIKVSDYKSLMAGLGK